MKFTDLGWHGVSVLIGGFACICFAAGDLWVFHALSKDTDLSLFFLGLGAFGVTGAYTAGLNSTPAPPAPKPLIP